MNYGIDIKKFTNIRKSTFFGLLFVLLVSSSFFQPSISGLVNSPYTFLSEWGSLGKGNGQFNNPHGVAVDSSDNVYVIEESNCRVQKFTSNGTFILKWGSQGSRDGQFNISHGGAVDSSGNVYIVEWLGNRVQKFTSNGTFILKWGIFGTGDGQFNNPHGVAVDSSGNVYVTDVKNNRIQKFTPNGTFILKWGIQGTGEGQFNGPRGIAIDVTGNVYVIDLGNNRIQKFTSDGKFISKWGVKGSENGQFDYPRGVAVDSFGNVYVTDINNNRIQKFTSDGKFISKWGEKGIGDGQFDELCGVVVSSKGFVYLTDVKNNRMLIFKPVDVPKVEINTFNVSDTRCNVNSVQTVTLHAKWANDSNIQKGTIGLNDRDYLTNVTGSIMFNVTSASVGATTWKITKIDCNGVSNYTQALPTPSIIWDQVKISDRGISSRSINIEQSITVWYKAVYQYDGELFDGSKGILFINGEALTWSSLNRRWEKQFTYDYPKTLELKITGIQDNNYGLTAFSESMPPIDVEWVQQQGISSYPMVSIIAGFMIALLIMRKKKGSPQNFLIK